METDNDFLTFETDRKDGCGSENYNGNRLSGVPDVVPKLKNVDFSGSLHTLYYDLAGAVMPKQFGILKQITDIDHLLYGSDSTFTPLHICEMLAHEMDNGLTDEETCRIYQENAKKLFGWSKENEWQDSSHEIMSKLEKLSFEESEMLVKMYNLLQLIGDKDLARQYVEDSEYFPRPALKGQADVAA